MMSSSDPSYAYIWEYIVRENCLAEFEAAYGPGGEWVQLFRRAEGYLRTELLRDRGKPNRFVTIDYWTSRAAWETFRERFTAEFDALDARCEGYTESEREVGTFLLAGRPER